MKAGAFASVEQVLHYQQDLLQQDKPQELTSAPLVHIVLSQENQSPILIWLVLQENILTLQGRQSLMIANLVLLATIVLQVWLQLVVYRDSIVQKDL